VLPGNADRKNREEDEGLGRGDFVTRPEKLLDILSEGGSGYHFFGKSAERITIRRNPVFTK
jgi:hypothetical protein